jgi:hypothetical protein
MLAAAAAVAILAFFVGYTTNEHAPSFKPEFTVAMRATPAGHGAIAALLVAKRDNAGNWPMLLRVEGLKQLPARSYYELFLTRHGKPVQTCGTFRVLSGVTEVRLNAPYDFRKFTGWVVTRHDTRGVVLRTRTV